MSSSPSSLIGITLSTIPMRCACNCHGTMLEWCSITDTITSSPGFINASTKELATRFMLSVVPLVNTTSEVEAALMNCRTHSLAASCKSVACCER